jgi:PAS domain S-box-containing protein
MIILPTESDCELFFQNSLDLLVFIGFDNHFKLVSPSFERMLGWKEEEVISKPFQDFLHPDDLERSSAKAQTQVKGDEAICFVNRYRCKDGSYKWISWNSHPIPEKQIIVGVGRDITERKKADEKLLFKEHELVSIYASVPEVLFFLSVKSDCDFSFSSVSQSFLQVTGLNQQQVVGKRVQEVIPEPSLTLVLEKYAQAIRERKTIRWEEETDYPSGKKYGEVTVTPFFDSSGRCTNLIGTVHDITERNKAEEALQSSEKQKNDILESITDGFVAFDKEWHYTYVNSNAARILHATKEELIGKVGLEVFPNASRFLVEFKRAVSSGRPVHFEEYYPEPLNIWYECHCYPSQDGLTVFFSDITQRKKSEEAIRKSQEREYSHRKELEALMETVPATIWISHDPKCLNMTGNKATYDLVGLPKNTNVSETAPKGQRPKNFLAYDSQGKPIPLRDLPMQVASRTGKPVFNSEFEFRFEDGHSVWVYGNVTPLLDDKGNPQGAIGAYVDITKRKKAEKTIEKSEQKLEEYSKNLEKIVEERTKNLELSLLYARNLIEASLDPLVTISIEGKITDVNKATELATGCSRKELIGSDFSDYFVEPEKAKIGYKKVFAEGVVKDYPLEIKHRNGRIINVLYNATVYRNNAGEIQGVFAAARDITEQKKAEAEAKEAAKKLKDSERLATIGATAGMVGHDIRNPLQAIIGDLYLLKDEVNNIPDGESKESAVETIDSIDDNINYINKIVSDLQDYARPLRPAAQKTDLTKILTALLETAHVPKKVKTHLQIQPEANQIVSDVDLLKRIFANLISNAAQAMPNGGKLTITATKTQDNTTVISVEDTGVGIPEEIKPNLFTPTFTTKSKGQGFGLAVVKRLSEALGGTVKFESEVGKGTTFTVRLPPSKSSNGTI